MFIKLSRKKPRNFLLSFLYKLDKFIPLSHRRKLSLYLDLEWAFERLAHERSFRAFPTGAHPVRVISTEFISKFLNNSQTIMDLGCNSGDLTILLSKHVKHISGVDYNCKLIEEAKRKYGNSGIDFICADALTYLKTNTENYDVLVLSHIIEHLDDPRQLLRSFKSFFRFIYIEVPDFERTHLNIYRYELKRDLIYSDTDHIWEFDRASLRQLIEDSGLRIVEMEFRLGVQKYWCEVLPEKPS